MLTDRAPLQLDGTSDPKKTKRKSSSKMKAGRKPDERKISSRRLKIFLLEDNLPNRNMFTRHQTAVQFTDSRTGEIILPEYYVTPSLEDALQRPEFAQPTTTDPFNLLLIDEKISGSGIWNEALKTNYDNGSEASGLDFLATIRLGTAQYNSLESFGEVPGGYKAPAVMFSTEDMYKRSNNPEELKAHFQKNNMGKLDLYTLNIIRKGYDKGGNINAKFLANLYNTELKDQHIRAVAIKPPKIRINKGNDTLPKAFSTGTLVIDRRPQGETSAGGPTPTSPTTTPGSVSSATSETTPGSTTPSSPKIADDLFNMSLAQPPLVRSKTEPPSLSAHKNTVSFVKGHLSLASLRPSAASAASTESPSTSEPTSRSPDSKGPTDDDGGPDKPMLDLDDLGDLETRERAPTDPITPTPRLSSWVFGSNSGSGGSRSRTSSSNATSPIPQSPSIYSDSSGSGSRFCTFGVPSSPTPQLSPSGNSRITSGSRSRTSSVPSPLPSITEETGGDQTTKQQRTNSGAKLVIR